MKILSIDASTKSTGWAIFEDQNLIESGFIAASGKDALDRIEYMRAELRKVYDEHLPQEIIIEDVIPDDVNNNQSVFKSLMYLQAAIVLEFHKSKKTLHFFVSSEWRKLCGIRTGRGIKRAELKSADIKFVKDTYNIDSNDDECDAICIGYAYTHPAKEKERESAF